MLHDGRVAIPANDQLLINQFVHRLTSVEYLHLRRLDLEVRNDEVIIIESSFALNDWLNVPAAKLQFDEESGAWTLFCVRGDEEWHVYPLTFPTADVSRLLAEIDSDPTSIFWG